MAAATRISSPGSPTGRGGALKPRPVRVRIPLRVHESRGSRHHPRLGSPTGRGGALRPRLVRVRIPPQVPNRPRPHRAQRTKSASAVTLPPPVPQVTWRWPLTVWTRLTVTWAHSTRTSQRAQSRLAIGIAPRVAPGGKSHSCASSPCPRRAERSSPGAGRGGGHADPRPRSRGRRRGRTRSRSSRTRSCRRRFRWRSPGPSPATGRAGR